MNGYLKQSTASQSRVIGPFLDDTDFKTEETGLTIANTDIKLRANGTTLSNKASGGGTHQANGCYSLTWDATDTANVGELFFTVKVAGALPVFGTYVVVEEATYDHLFGASADPKAITSVSGAVGSVTGAVGSVTGSVGSVAAGGITASSIAADAITAAKVADGTIDAATFAAGAINAAAIATDAITAAKIAADAIGASELAADAVAELADAVWDEDATAHQTQGTFGQAIGDPVADTGTLYKAVVTDATAATVGLDVVALKTETASIQADTDNLQTRLPTSLVSGRIDASVGAMAAGTVTAAAVATDAIDADALATDAVNELRDAVFARAFSAAYGSYTFDQLTSMIAAVLLAKCSGMATTTGTFRNLADSADVIVATQDANGNRTAITRTP